MAVYTETLKAITDRRKAPFANFQKTMTGVDEYRFFAGYLMEVPNVWEVCQLRVVLATDATVANRTLRVRQVVKSSTLIEAIGDNVPASTSVTHLYFPMGYESATMSAAFLGLNPKGMTIDGDTDHLKITVDTGKAGDTVTINVNFRWLNWELGMLPPYALTPYEKMIQAQEYPRYY